MSTTNNSGLDGRYWVPLFHIIGREREWGLFGQLLPLSSEQRIQYLFDLILATAQAPTQPGARIGLGNWDSIDEALLLYTGLLFEAVQESEWMPFLQAAPDINRPSCWSLRHDAKVEEVETAHQTALVKAAVLARRLYREIPASKSRPKMPRTSHVIYTKTRLQLARGMTEFWAIAEDRIIAEEIFDFLIDAMKDGTYGHLVAKALRELKKTPKTASRVSDALVRLRAQFTPDKGPFREVFDSLVIVRARMLTPDEVINRLL